jgi:hypothetical protein
MIDKDIMVLQNYTNLEKEILGPCDEMYPTSDDANQIKNVKAEEFPDTKEEEDPGPMAFPKIKAEAEVSCMYVHCKKTSQLCRNASCPSDLHLSVCAHEVTPHH